MRFTLKQITYFVAAAETSSITLAAERANISQPSISSAIALLEENFGIQLFIRHHAQGLSLTTDGQRFLHEARALLHQAHELQLAAKEISKRIGGPLDIGCLATLFPLVVPELIQRFKGRHGNVRINAVAGHQEELLASLRNGRIAMLLTYDMAIPADVDFLPLAQVKPYVFVHAYHRYAHIQAVPLGAFKDEPFLLLDLPLSRDYFLGLFRTACVTPIIAGRYAHMDVIRSLVARGEGYGLANAKPKNRFSLDGRELSYIGLEYALPSLTHGIATLKGVRRTPTLKSFLHFCEVELKDRVLPGTV